MQILTTFLVHWKGACERVRTGREPLFPVDVSPPPQVVRVTPEQVAEDAHVTWVLFFGGLGLFHWRRCFDRPFSFLCMLSTFARWFDRHAWVQLCSNFSHLISWAIAISQYPCFIFWHILRCCRHVDSVAMQSNCLIQTLYDLRCEGLKIPNREDSTPLFIPASNALPGRME